MKKNKHGWAWYKPNTFLWQGSLGFWQKQLEEEYANIVCWPPIGVIKKSFAIEIQIDGDRSITRVTTNVNSFSYKRLNFVEMEKHALKLIKALTKG